MTRSAMLCWLVATATMIGASARPAAAQAGPAAVTARSAATPHPTRPVAWLVGGAPHLVRDAAGSFRVRDAEGARSRARGAKIGALTGAVIGGLAGLAITNDFMDEPVVNLAGGAMAGGLIGLVIGAAVGAPAPRS